MFKLPGLKDLIHQDIIFHHEMKDHLLQIGLEASEHLYIRLPLPPERSHILSNLRRHLVYILHTHHLLFPQREVRRHIHRFPPLPFFFKKNSLFTGNPFPHHLQQGIQPLIACPAVKRPAHINAGRHMQLSFDLRKQLPHVIPKHLLFLRDALTDYHKTIITMSDNGICHIAFSTHEFFCHMHQHRRKDRITLRFPMFHPPEDTQHAKHQYLIRTIYASFRSGRPAGLSRLKTAPVFLLCLLPIPSALIRTGAHILHQASQYVFQLPVGHRL